MALSALTDVAIIPEFLDECGRVAHARTSISDQLKLEVASRGSVQTPGKYIDFG